MKKFRNGTCLHCRRFFRIQGRGLCGACYTRPGVREQYPAQPNTGANRHDPTEAELNQMIAEQLPTMPTGRYAEDSPGDSIDRIRVIRREKRK